MATQKPELDLLRVRVCVCEGQRGGRGLGEKEGGTASSLDFLTEGSLTLQLNKSSGCDLPVGGGGGMEGGVT